MSTALGQHPRRIRRGWTTAAAALSAMLSATLTRQIVSALTPAPTVAALRHSSTLPLCMRLTLFLAAFALIPLGGFADGREAAPASDLAAADSPELKSGRERLDECRKLFRDGKQNEAVKLAMSSVDIFVAPYRQLRWIDVGAIETEKYRVVIHVNTTEDERAKVKEDIVRPYTFCVFPKEPNGKLLYVIDFEHGYKAGVLKSAALGRYSGGAHFNYGMISAKADFTTVRDAALKLIRTDTIKPSIR